MLGKTQKVVENNHSLEIKGIKEKMEIAHKLLSVAFIGCLFMLIYLIVTVSFNPLSYPEEFLSLLWVPIFLDIIFMFYLLYLLMTKEKRTNFMITLYKDFSEKKRYYMKLKNTCFIIIPISILIMILGVVLYYRYSSDYFVFIFIIGLGALSGAFFGINDANKNLKNID